MAEGYYENGIRIQHAAVRPSEGLHDGPREVCVRCAVATGVVEYARSRFTVDPRDDDDAALSAYQRPPWNDYFLGIAKAVSARADCHRARHGAIVVKERRIRATGYNAAAPGGPSCLAGKCPRGLSDVPSGSSYDSGPGTCISLHAEQNALLFASRDDCEGGTIYITGKPCAGCWRMIQGSGLSYALWPELTWPTPVSTPYGDLL